MAHKKRNPTSRSKPSPPAEDPPPSTADADSPESDACNAISDQSCDGGYSPSSYTAIKLECERALTALRRGNRARALKLMKECCSRHESSGFAHRVQGTLCVKVAATLDDPTAKQRHLRAALESARRAVELSPNSIEFAYFYANLMFELGTEAKEFEDVARECSRALAVDRPIDPARESLQEEELQQISTAEARIAHVQGELRQLVQKTNIAALSCWMKNLGTGDEKFRLIPIRRAVTGEEDPMEVGLVQGRRPNEVKKSTKTPEERRKEIEVRVAAARLMQQKAESPKPHSEGDRDERALESPNSGSGHRRRYGHMRKNGSNFERKGWVKSYWDAMSVDMKKELLSIRVFDIKSHFGSLKDTLPMEVLSEALSYGHANRRWKFWLCCRCGEKFSNSDSHGQHVVQEHMGNLLPEIQRVLPRNADSEWVEMILNCAWKPVDVMAAVEMVESKARFGESSFNEDSYLDHHTDDYIGSFKEACDSYPDNRILRHSLRSCTAEVSSYCRIAESFVRNRVEAQGSIVYPIVDSWPISDDPERAKLLGRIRAVFEMLIRHKYLAASHLNKVMQITVDEIQGLAGGSELLNHGVDRTPMCICFLGAAQLKKVLQFLQELSHACGLGRYTEKSSGPLDDSHNTRHGPEIKEKIVLNADASYLLLDECLLPLHVDAEAQGAVLDDVNGPTPPVVVSYNTDALLSWIFSGLPSGDQLKSWMRTIEDRRHQGVEIVQMLEKEFYHLQGLCDKKCDRLGFEGALQVAEDLYLEESRKRENLGEFFQRSYESILRRRREELIESENNATFVGNRFELDAISNVLQEAEAMTANQFGYEEGYGAMTSPLCDLESGDGDGWRMRENLHQTDDCMEIAFQKVKEHSAVELGKIDARIMRSVAEMQQLEIKLGPISAHDYRAILLPLVQSYLRAHLENLAEKDATEKSDAAREAFLAELALDSKKIVKGGSENTRHFEKTKDKKKNKDNRKAKDLKATNGHEDLLLQATIPESDFHPVSPDGNYHDSKVVVPMNTDYLDQQEEEFRRKIELEEDEKRLKETLEYQRRIENEAKQKHLAKQQIKSSGTYLEKAEDKTHDAQLKVVADGPDVHEVIRLPMQEKLATENGHATNLDAMLITPTNGSMVSIKSSADSAAQNLHFMHHLKTNQADLGNGVVPEDGLPDQRAGRKHKRRKNPSKLVDGYVALEKENNGVTQAHNHFRGQFKVLNNHDANKVWGDDGPKMLKELQVEDEEEERFQADLKNAVRQSLDTYQAHRKVPLISSLGSSQRASPQVEEETWENVNGTTLIGTGLKNEVGEYNCFLNVIIQSLWHLRCFREEFLGRSRSEHDHVGNPCVVCALYDIFIAMDVATKDSSREAVAPTSLRIALSNLYPDSNFFQEAQMNDASEVLAVTFDCLHRSFTRGSSASDMESMESNCTRSWDCANKNCIVHSLFGMDICEQMNCYHCGLESRHLKYTSFFHNINASAFRTMKFMSSESSFDKLLNLVEMNHQLACDPEVGGCGKLNYVHHFLSTPPRVFMIVLGWQNTCESADDIKATVSALSTKINISVLYCGLDPESAYSLVSVVCYYGQHYHCFAYSHDREQWIMYDDKTVKVIGGWADVITMCERGRLQPQVLFFEAVN